MQHITTTDLRTKSSELINTLKKGESVSLIHRSKIVGVIKPAQKEAKLFNVKTFREIAKSLKPKRLIPPKKRDEVYRKHLIEKYGKGIS